MENQAPKIKISKNGPYTVFGNLPLDKGIMVPDESRDPVEWENIGAMEVTRVYQLCRCGHSQNKPFCDNSHMHIEFDGTETAANIPYLDMAKAVEGPTLILTDARSYCASGRFCNRAGNAWDLTEESDNPEKRAIAIEEACNCPSGRLIAWDRETGLPFEKYTEPAISVAEDPGRHVSGPLFVKGGIELISSDGTAYEVRNRMALCRCGHSQNKPFCDGSHIKVKFNDGDESIL